MTLPRNIVLALAGGNALGAYQAGAYEALQERGLQPRWVAGASMGALNGAIIAGNAPADRLDRLRAFWRMAEQSGHSDPSSRTAGRHSSRLRKSAAANETFLTGRPGLFAPRLFGFWPFGLPAEQVSLFDTSPMMATLPKFIDFERLNGGAVRFTATAVDVESGEDVVFDTREGRVETEHLRASAAFPVMYPPVEVDGRVLMDPGVSANLPLRVLFSRMPEEDTLCLAVDLVTPYGERPRGLGDALKRAHDLVFANQAWHAIQALRTEFKLHAAERELAAHAIAAGEPARPALGSITLLHVPYAESGRESAAKMFDYSAASVQERWASGYRDMQDGLAQLPKWELSDKPGFTALRLERGEIAEIR